jgi:predicted transcriptional regulator of viral defense system
VCSIDPFAYISHLSAMEFHGLTDKIPRVLIYSSPDQKAWRTFAHKKMQKDFSGNKPDTLPLLSLNKIKKFGKKNIIKFSSIHTGAYISIKNRALRVSSIGRTFLDMIRRPDLCDGIYNVIQAYEDYAEQYLDLILDEIDRNGNKIEKVRSGYIMEERCNIRNNPRIEKWKENAQRGGSRKLDPNNDYYPNFSKSWCLSINIED